jgi:hypothetical protein
MKTIRTSTGPFKERPFFEAEDIEQICTDELRAAGLFPTTPEPIRIDRFIEKRFHVSHRYDDLPEGVLGYTKFGKNGVEDIVVAKKLDEEQTDVSERRLSTTLGHEAGHGLLHAHLFVLGTKPLGLFGDSQSREPVILCRNETARSKYDGSWWEFQANQAMASLLMPRKLVEVAVSPYLISTGILGAKYLEKTRRKEAETSLAQTFGVNPIVARLRLDTFYPDTPQLHL